MINIEMIVPYQGFSETVNEALECYPFKEKINLILTEIDYSLIHTLSFAGDVVIARGLTASYLNSLRKNNNIILELPMMGYDMLRSLYRGMNRCNAQHIGIVTTPEVLIGFKEEDIQFPIRISTYPIVELSNIDSVIRKAKADGVDLIVGGDSVVTACESNGMNFERIDAGVECIHHVLDEAIYVFTINKEERLRVERLNAIIENIDEGIIYCDGDCKITSCNNYISSLFKKDVSEIIGKDLRFLNPMLDDPKISSLSQIETGKLITVDKRDIAVNRIPILVDGNMVAGVLVFQNYSNIHKIESAFRKNVKSKNFTAKYHFDDILGSGQRITYAKDTAKEYSKVDANVLIFGETGTGKEVFAQSIHNASSRSDKPFVAVNCAAIPASLLESELFGYVGGAFTGASKEGKMGLFELAHKGTIFLDEISEMSLELQGRLLRVIEQREILRIGDDQVLPIDIRIIAATNKNLQELVAKNLFRNDLFYRLDVLRLNLPSLREMKSDIPRLFEYYIKKYDAKYNKSHLLAPDIFDYICEQKWPGNIRQLRNNCERLSIVVLKSIISLEDVRSCAAQSDYKSINGADEVSALDYALQITGGNKREAAKLMGIDRSTLYRRLKKNDG